ncbi:conserved hypothetical protein [Candidatus Defluviicoccus seviourii]|uniref:Uncharacterized protein n=2 Tax=root TaxID=1 RepID=A0A564W930_9PROT|nr:conserved hypothetical protein [uncultured Defluviicoccus sp.]VUX44959.1 conserved hypothetical protein [Candidatus Defluviicoccus seviourii]HRW61750.1 hypothetical protein [Defluviicoccus sp.]
MPRKPNYHADRMERERAKAAKRAKRDEARSERTAKNKTGQDEGTEAQAEASPREDQ